MTARKTAAPQSTFCPNPDTPTSTLAYSSRVAVVDRARHHRTRMVTRHSGTTVHSRSNRRLLELHEAYDGPEPETSNHGCNQRAGPRRDEQCRGSFIFQIHISCIYVPDSSTDYADAPANRGDTWPLPIWMERYLSRMAAIDPSDMM